MKEIEKACFQIISAVGTARSNFIEALKATKEGRIDEAKELIKEGVESYFEGHSIHFDLVKKEASGQNIVVSLLLVHAEDLMMSAETLRIVLVELIDQADRIATLEKALESKQ
jgi:PTS system cellobiose-specific IIA component